VTELGEGFRGVEGRLGFLLVQAQQSFASAMELVLREAGGLTRSQFGALSVIVREPGLSAADLARALLVTPQAVNLVVGGLERAGLVERRPHATHGRILELFPTDEGARQVRATYPLVTALEDRIAAGLSPRQLADVKRWLVRTAISMNEVTHAADTD
jgi:DNA-binding MarR family transcriptional regulator